MQLLAKRSFQIGSSSVERGDEIATIRFANEVVANSLPEIGDMILNAVVRATQNGKKIKLEAARRYSIVNEVFNEGDDVATLEPVLDNVTVPMIGHMLLYSQIGPPATTPEQAAADIEAASQRQLPDVPPSVSQNPGGDVLPESEYIREPPTPYVDNIAETSSAPKLEADETKDQCETETGFVARVPPIDADTKQSRDRGMSGRKTSRASKPRRKTQSAANPLPVME